MNRYAAIIDACVLGGGLKRNIILSLAEAGLFRPYWSARILDETEKAILAISKGTADPSRQRRVIERAFPEAMVFPNSDPDLLGLLPDPGDEHVLAAAIAARCDTLVTDNLKDFPQGILDRWGSKSCRLMTLSRMPWISIMRSQSVRFATCGRD